MDLFDIAVARKLSGGGGGGGGGDSDFSTAQVTVTSVDDATTDFYAPLTQESEGGQPAIAYFQGYAQNGATLTYNIILYKGMAVGWIPNGTYAISATSGGVQSVGNNYFMVTGDGTLTIGVA